MKWVTREDAKVDRIACPWLIRRFVDADAEFLYVPAGEVKAVAEREGRSLATSPASSSGTWTAGARSRASSSSTGSRGMRP